MTSSHGLVIGCSSGMGSCLLVFMHPVQSMGSVGQWEIGIAYTWMLFLSVPLTKSLKELNQLKFDNP